jgi:sugar phosphate isomerase/epimerase
MIELCMNTMNRSAWFDPGGDPDLLGQIAAAGRAGFGSIGPDHYSIVRHVELGGSVEALADAIAEAGLRTFELPTWIVGEDLAQARADAEALRAVAQRLHPDFVQVNVMVPVDDALLDVMRREGERFLELGARLAIESLPWLPEIRDLSSTRALLPRLALEGAGICLDVWHFTHSSDTWAELDDLPLEEIAYVQFDDHPPLASDDLIHETVSRRAMPGEGCFELDRFCERVRAKGYAAPVSCEILSEATRDMDLDLFARRVFESCRRYWP